MPPSSLEVNAVLDGVAVGAIGGVCIVVWRGPVTRPRFDAQYEGLRSVVSRSPQGAGLLCVIEPTSRPPADELRRASANMVREHEGRLRGIACVVEGAGFGNALARSALSAIALILGPRKTPFAIHANVGEASAWMSRRMPTADLEAGVGTLRARLSPWVDGAS